jgi:hypothetical protein
METLRSSAATSVISGKEDGMEQHNKVIAASLSQGRKTRVCPYCKNCIPAHEDPCHHCGHLEPGEATNRYTEVENPWMHLPFLLLGIAIIIGPYLMYPGTYACEMGEMSACLVDFVQEALMGIVLVVFSLYNITRPGLSSAWRNIRQHGELPAGDRGRNGKGKVTTQPAAR